MSKHRVKQANVIKVCNPYTGRIVGSVKKSTRQEIIKVVTRAKNAFKKNRFMSAFKRHLILKKACELLIKDCDCMADLITRETAKPLKESYNELERASFVLEQCAEESMRVCGEVLPCDVTVSEIDKKAITFRRPRGVIAAVTPFNYPLNIAVHKVAPAIAAGNACVLKPSPLAPLASVKFREIMLSAGLPKDMFGIVHGFEKEAEILVSANVDMVSFTGSTKAGMNIVRLAGMKKLSLELGGNCALVVFGDADIKGAVETCIDQRFRTAGQRCTAIKRLFLHEDIYDKFILLLLKRARRLKAGNPMSDKCDIGPLINENAAITAEARISEAVKKGAKLLCGGKRKGNFVYPTVLDDVPEDCELIRKETFGPILPAFKFRKVGEVIRKVNSTQYGLQAGVYTNRMDVIKRFSRELEVGTLVVNGGPGLRLGNIPFGGVKESGMGTEGVRYAINEMTEITSVVI